jgi:hypothetical protein
VVAQEWAVVQVWVVVAQEWAAIAVVVRAVQIEVLAVMVQVASRVKFRLNPTMMKRMSRFHA